MDSQLALVLTSGSLDNENGSQHLEKLGSEAIAYSGENIPPSTQTGILQPCAVLCAVTSRGDGLSINGKMTEVGGISRPASQEISESGGFKQPIIVKTGMPVLRNQPIRIKIVVPPRHKGPNKNSPTSVTKDSPNIQFIKPMLVSTEAVLSGLITEKNTSKIPTAPVSSALRNDGETNESEKTQKPEAESLLGMVAGEEREQRHNERHVTEDQCGSANINHSAVAGTPPISTNDTPDVLRQPGTQEESTQIDYESKIQCDLKSTDWRVTGGEEAVQTEPLDLSLPRKGAGSERRCGRFLDDSGCESSLIMEVDEFEGDGDRDVVEEDDDGEEGGSRSRADGVDAFENSFLSPALFPTSVPASLSSLDDDDDNDEEDGGDDDDDEKLLLIDDQGIPYTLSSDGHKVPQINSSQIEDPPPVVPAVQPSTEVKGTPQPATNSNQSFDSTLHTPGTTLASITDSQSPDAELSEAAALMGTQLTESSKAQEPCARAANEASGVLPQAPGVAAPGQPIQIVTTPSSNASILLLSSASSSVQSIPISVTSAATSAPMLLLLSPVPSSSSGQSAPIAVLDTSTGQLSQITASSAAVSLPLSSSRVAALGAPLSHPVIRVSPNHAPVIFTGVGTTVNPAPVLPLPPLSVPSCPSTQTGNLTPSGGLGPAQSNLFDSNAETEAIPAEETPSENAKSLTAATALPSPRSESPGSTFDPSGQPGSDATERSSSPELTFKPRDLRSEPVPLEDHLYFSSAAAPPSPPVGPTLSSGQLESMDPLDPLDPLSPAASPNSMGPRRVLYCQLCPRVFFYLSDLERHAITHSQKKPHVCQQCGKAFKRSSHLQRHKHIHTGQRNYVCPICAKRFREAGELQRHQRVHTGEKPYQCQLCHTRFAERNTLRRHTKRKHPFHQVAMEMLSERRGGTVAGGGAATGGGVVQEDEEESAEWYSSTVSNFDNSESEMET